MHAVLMSHAPAAEPTDLYDGSETGMAASTIRRTPLTVQQEIPNIQPVQIAPQTQVVAALEQGEGRAPGWKWAWMRKNIPYSPEHIAGHMQRNFGPLRPGLPLGYESTRRLNRPGQTILEHVGKAPPVSLEQPQNQTATVSYPIVPTWGEPL